MMKNCSNNFEHGFRNDQAQFIYDLANERVIPVLDQLTVSFEAQKQLAKLSAYFGGQERFDEASRQISAWAKQKICVRKSTMLWLQPPRAL